MRLGPPTVQVKAQPEQPKALEVMQNRFSALHGQLVTECNRLDNAVDRIAPTPKNPQAGADAKAALPQGYLNRFEMVAGNLGAVSVRL